MKAGYIKLYREIQDHDIWTKEPACWAKAWIDLLLLASHNEHRTIIKKKPYTLNRGDIAISKRFLMKRWKWGSSKTHAFIGFLNAEHMIVKKQTGSGSGSPSVYHIVNYDSYQGYDHSPQTASQTASRPLPDHFQTETKNYKKGEEVDCSDSFFGSVNIERENHSLAVAEKRNGRADPAYDFFSDKFKSERGLPYRSTTADFVQLARLRKAFGIDTRATPQKWQQAVENYFTSPLSSYSLKDLCTRLDVFMAAPLDRYGKPDVPEEDYFAKQRRRLNLEEDE